MEAIMQNRFGWSRGVSVNAKVEDTTVKTDELVAQMSKEDKETMLGLLRKTKEGMKAKRDE
jgi:hypothetical protein